MDHDRVLDALRALAEPTRLRLMALLSESELTVTELVDILGQSQPRLSRHIKLLCDAGLLDRAPEGVNVFLRSPACTEAGRLVRGVLDFVPKDDPVLALDRRRLAALRQTRAVSADAYFRRHAAEWDRIRSLHIPESDVEAAIRNLLPRCRVGDLLDIGTGTGRMIKLCAADADRAIGVDLSREMLAVARANLEGPDFRHCTLRRAPAENLPFADASFDVVLSHMVLHFLPDPARAVAEAARVLRPGGRMILVDFARHDATILGPAHAHRWPGFSDETIGGWFENAGLILGRSTALPGRALTVKLWCGERRRTALESRLHNSNGANLEIFP
jgi:ArsR family transcriptional regulator